MEGPRAEASMARKSYSIQSGLRISESTVKSTARSRYCDEAPIRILHSGSGRRKPMGMTGSHSKCIRWLSLRTMRLALISEYASFHHETDGPPEPATALSALDESFGSTNAQAHALATSAVPCPWYSARSFSWCPLFVYSSCAISEVEKDFQ